MKVNMLYSRSAYAIDKPHMSKTKTDEFCYPCIVSVLKDGLTIQYSNTKDNGHFGIPKFVWTSGAYGSTGYIDIKGEYGLTAFAQGIADTPENLVKIKQVFNSEAFKQFAEGFDDNYGSINRKVIALFKQDFWREFL